jgi:isoquinoline 1-oxidoreductase subunit beta
METTDRLTRASLSRRGFLQKSARASGGFMLGFAFPAGAATLVGAAKAGPGQNQAAVTAWVRISPGNEVTLLVSQAEIGQGISTTLPAIMADELGADWSSVKLETAPFSARATAYRNPRLNFMFTGNSESIESFHDLMRKTGAAAREMLIQTAATRWGVSADSCRAQSSLIIHVPSGRRLSFGELAADAAALRFRRTRP